MRDKLLKVPFSQWFKLDDRADKDLVINVINELIADGYLFKISDDKTKFMRTSNDLFEWAEKSTDSEVKIRSINGKKIYDLYCNGKLIATK